jgi:hypothetical protein
MAGVSIGSCRTQNSAPAKRWRCGPYVSDDALRNRGSDGKGHSGVAAVKVRSGGGPQRATRSQAPSSMQRNGFRQGSQ